MPSGGKGKNSSPPAAPDYVGAAEQTARSQMVNQNTPFGSLTYGADPSSPSGYQATSSMGGQYSQPMDLSSVPQIADKAYSTLTSRLDPQWQQREQQQKTELANQGLAPGGEAYTNAMRDFGQARNDAYQQANLAAIQTMPQTYNLAEAAYNQPLNTFNLLRGGMKPGAGLQPTDYSGAAEASGNYAGDVYNAKVGQQNSNMQGIASIAAMAAMFF